MPTNPALELVDVVDEDGRTLGVVSRAEMRSRRLRHRCTYLFVFNRHGELFVHLRTPTKDVFPSYWDVAVGGVLAAGEDFDQGAQRELSEELGVQGHPERLFPFEYADHHSIVQGMVYRVTHDGPFVYQLEEVVRGEFIPLDQLPGRVACDPFCPDGLAALAEYRRRYCCLDSVTPGARP